MSWKGRQQEWYEVVSLSGEIRSILEHSTNPRPVHTILFKLACRGFLPRDDYKRYWPWVSKWLQQQDDIVSSRKGKDPKREYILKDNARKYWPEFLEGEEQ